MVYYSTDIEGTYISPDDKSSNQNYLTINFNETNANKSSPSANLYGIEVGSKTWTFWNIDPYYQYIIAYWTNIELKNNYEFAIFRYYIDKESNFYWLWSSKNSSNKMTSNNYRFIPTSAIYEIVKIVNERVNNPNSPPPYLCLWSKLIRNPKFDLVAPMKYSPVVKITNITKSVSPVNNSLYFFKNEDDIFQNYIPIDKLQFSIKIDSPGKSGDGIINLNYSIIPGLLSYTPWIIYLIDYKYQYIIAYTSLPNSESKYWIIIRYWIMKNEGKNVFIIRFPGEKGEHFIGKFNPPTYLFNKITNIVNERDNISLNYTYLSNPENIPKNTIQNYYMLPDKQEIEQLSSLNSSNKDSKIETSKDINDIKKSIGIFRTFLKKLGTEFNEIVDIEKDINNAILNDKITLDDLKTALKTTICNFDKNINSYTWKIIEELRDAIETSEDKIKLSLQIEKILKNILPPNFSQNDLNNIINSLESEDESTTKPTFTTESEASFRENELITDDLMTIPQLKQESVLKTQLILNNIPCFTENAIVETDQGNFKIKDIIPYKMTIKGKPIIKLLKKKLKCNLIILPKSCLGLDKPNQDTEITSKHKLLWKKKLIESRHFIGFNNIKIINAKLVDVYNILLAKHDLMKVNNIVVETMNPIYL